MSLISFSSSSIQIISNSFKIISRKYSEVFTESIETARIDKIEVQKIFPAKLVKIFIQPIIWAPVLGGKQKQKLLRICMMKGPKNIKEKFQS